MFAYCLSALADRNIAALMDILKEHEGQTVVVGTHGTALSTILNYFDKSFGCDDFLRIIDMMPYIIELIAIQTNNQTSSARRIARGCVIVLEIRQYSCVLFLATYNPASPPFVRLFIWIAIGSTA